jgi:hypothetical protein
VTLKEMNAENQDQPAIDLMSPFHASLENPERWEPTFREDVNLSRREALESCIEGVRQLMKPEEFDQVMTELKLPPQET